MLPIADFQVRRIREPTTDEVPLVQLSFREREVGDAIPGATLEQQFRLDEGRFLLFLTDDVPYEETLRIYLLSKDFRILDGLEFGGAYVTGSLENVTIKDSRTLEFSFVHKNRCRLHVHQTARWQLPLLFMPGVSRVGPWRQKSFLQTTFLK